MPADVLQGEALREAYAWLADCTWADMEADDIAALSPVQVTRAVARHYEGSIAAFLAAG